MPYIKQEERQILDSWIDQLRTHILTPGELNYVITRLCEIDEISYNNINEKIGVLECAKLELYRRLAVYEDSKIQENGDIDYYERANKRYRHGRTSCGKTCGKQSGSGENNS